MTLPMPMMRPYAGELTPRQWDVLRIMASGQTIAQAAFALGITFQTVKNHLGASYRVLQAANITHAVALLDDWRPGWRPRLPAHPVDNPAAGRFVAFAADETGPSRVSA